MLFHRPFKNPHTGFVKGQRNFFMKDFVFDSPATEVRRAVRNFTSFVGDDSEEDIEGEGNDVIIDRADSAVAGTNSLIITDNVDAANPIFMISVTFDRDQN